MAHRQIVYMDLGGLQIADTNPKMHDLPTLVASIGRFGFTQPILLDERTGKMVAGHGRREALIWIREQGEVMPDGVIQDDDGEWLVPVERGWSSRNDTEAEAYIIADNQTTVAGGWHMKTLAQMLEDVVTEDAGLMDTLGFTSDDVDDIIRRIDPETLNADPDADPWDTPLPDPDKPAKAAADSDEDPEAGLDDEKPVKALDPVTCPACSHTWDRG